MNILMVDRLRNFLLTTFIGGITVILPIVLFIWLINLMIHLVRAVVSPLSSLFTFDSQNYLLIDLLALVIVITICFLTGLMMRTKIGSGIYRYIEQKWLERLPVYSSIRDIVRQFTGRKSAPFKQVVLCDPYGTGTLMTGFVTDQQGDNYTVFVPTAPNPTNGFVFHMQHDQLTFVEAKTEDAMRTVVGMGAGSQELLISKSNSTSPEKS